MLGPFYLIDFELYKKFVSFKNEETCIQKFRNKTGLDITFRISCATQFMGISTYIATLSLNEYLLKGYRVLGILLMLDIQI